MSDKKTSHLALPQRLKLAELAKKKGEDSTFTASDEQKQNVRALLRSSTDAEKLVHVSDALNKESPKDNTRHIDDQFSEVDDAWSSLPVEHIQFYEKNPRKAINEAYAELKESIRVKGILQPLTVTKRPGQSNYILYAGGNTRLSAIKELWSETGDSRYKETRVIIKKWRGESAVMLAHMAENTQRSDMTFWDKANGILDIRLQMDSENGSPLSNRDFEQRLEKEGIKTDLRALSMYKFATDKLKLIGPFLAQPSTRLLQPHLNALMKLAQFDEAQENDFYTTIINPVLAKYVEELELIPDAKFSVEKVIKLCDASVAEYLQIDSKTVDKLIVLMGKDESKNLTFDEMLELIRKQDEETQQKKSEASSTQKANKANVEEKSTDDETSTPTSISVSTDSKLDSGHQVDSTSDEYSNLIKSLLVESSLASYMCLADDMPLGFYIDFPDDGPLDLKDNGLDRQSAWWVLASISGQFDNDIVKQALPKGDKWRSVLLDEGGESGNLGSLELAIQHHINSPSMLHVDWLLDSSNQVAALCLKVMSMHRKLGGVL